jgi:FkbM family methyltransferase
MLGRLLARRAVLDQSLAEEIGPSYSQKFYLEEKLHRDPDNASLLDLYFTTLFQLSCNSFGVMHASLPGYPAPLFFRGMTTDVHNMRQIFQHKEYAFDLGARPQRILDLGGYAGYAAVFLANRFPNAEIVSIEPSPTNFRILRINTSVYENIRAVHGAVWHRSTQLVAAGRIDGDWGSVFHERADGGTDAGVRAFTGAEILELAGWSAVDYVKCDIEGAEQELFSDPNSLDWLKGAHWVSVETHDRFKLGCTETVEKAFPPSRYERSLSGEFHVFSRLADVPDEPADRETSAEIILLVPQTLRNRRFERINIPTESWGFCVIDDETFQLHPMAPGQGRSEIVFHLDLTGQSEFTALCHLPERSEGPVVFSVRLLGPKWSVFEESATVVPGEMLDLRLDIPKREGPYRLALGTAMAPAASSNGYAWAQWTRPCLR